MKKVFYICTILLTLATSVGAATAQTSGWEDKGEYKEQKLRIPNLQAIAFSPDSSLFYTLHNNKTVYYWDYKTGKLIDSLIFLDNGYQIKFSNDGNTLIAFSDFDIKDTTITTDIIIINLISKQRIAHSTIRIPEDIDYDSFSKEKQLMSHRHKLQDPKFQILDFNSSINILEVGINFDYIKKDSIILDRRTHKITLGAVISYRIQQKTLIKNVQVANQPVINYIKFKDLLYETIIDNQYTNFFIGDTKINEGFVTNYMLLKINNQFKDTTAIRKSQYSRIVSSNGKGYDTKESGSYLPYTRLLLDSVNERLFVQSYEVYRCFDLSTNEELFSITIPYDAYCETFDSKLLSAIYYLKGKVYTRRVFPDSVVSGLSVPFFPNSIKLVPISEDIAVTSDSGRIVILKKFKSIPLPPLVTAELFIRPNPATDVLFLPIDNELIGARIEIYTQTGALALETTYSERIDISSLPAGVYYLRTGGRIGEFVKQ